MTRGGFSAPLRGLLSVGELHPFLWPDGWYAAGYFTVLHWAMQYLSFNEAGRKEGEVQIPFHFDLISVLLCDLFKMSRSHLLIFS